MLEAYISGQARLAAVIEGDALWCLRAGKDKPEIRDRIEFEYLFADTGDLKIERCTDWIQTSARLRTAILRDDALALLLILLDKDACQEARAESAALVEEALRETGVEQFLHERMSGAPLPANADIAGSIYRTEQAGSQLLGEFLRELQGLQPAIMQIHSAWENLASDCFVGLTEKLLLQRTLRDLGVHYSLARQDLTAAVEKVGKWDTAQKEKVVELIRRWFLDARRLPECASVGGPLPEQTLRTEDQRSAEQRSLAVRNALASLEPRDRQILIDLYRSGLARDEICSKYEISQHQLRTILIRTRSFFPKEWLQVS